jgi:AraC-like DNA-binding protein
MKNIEFESFNSVINAVQLTILEHGHLFASTDWKFLNLSSPFNRLYFIVKGNAYVRCGEKDIVLEPGNMYLIPLNNTCDYICEDYLEKFYIHFRLEMVPGHDLFEGYDQCTGIPFDITIVEQLISSGEQGSIENLIKSKGILLSSIAAFMKRTCYSLDGKLGVSLKYHGLYKYINDHCSAALRVSKIAEYFNVSASNLSTKFRKDMGLTLKKYLDKKVIQKAQEELLITNKTIKEIAYDLQFNDEFHFSRCFKRYVGVSPSQYRKRSNTYK